MLCCDCDYFVEFETEDIKDLKFGWCEEENKYVPRISFICEKFNYST